MSCLTSLDSITKSPDEILAVSMDFVNILDDNTISSYTIAITPTGITTSSDSISGTTVQFKVSGGTAGITYKVKITIVTSNSETLVGFGDLKVREA